MLIQPKDITKECAKIVLPLLISTDNRFIKNYAFEYGCEAVWSGYYDGIDTIPGALIKYACVDACYYQLCKAGKLISMDYPTRIKNQAILYSAARVFAPLFIKRCIANTIDGILSQLSECDQEGDQLLAYNSSFESDYLCSN